MNEFLRLLTGLCLMRLTVDLALPEGDASRYADLGAGLLTLLCILRAALALLRGLP
ncbi:MAG: hypothetical protein IJ662_13405 [Clostridia bacterium]|nr:hypothetical protein [Clostridia bacterium]